jgi:hypothetical protein
MELRFVQSESAFDYFRSTVTYLKRHGKPVAFYSDKHSIFRVAAEGATGRSKGVSQFGRALAALNIDIICANSPQAKGRVERMNQTLQVRLVKELRLRDIATMAAGSVYLLEFMEDYNRRFARLPRNPHDAHRALRGDEDLRRIFSWQEERTLSRNLTVHFKRVTYLIEKSPAMLAVAGRRVLIHEWEDGTVEIQCEGCQLPYSVFDNNPVVRQGAVVENKRLGAVLTLIQGAQAERDRARLAAKSLTNREKSRIVEARTAAGVTPRPTPVQRPPAEGRLDVMVAYLNAKKEEQFSRRKRINAMAAVRRAARQAERPNA